MAIDSASIASQLAGFDVQPFEAKYQNKITTAQSQLSAYAKIKASLESLDDKIYDLNKVGESIGKSSTSLSNDEFFDLTASSGISNMNMDIFVEQLATSHQVVMDVPATTMDEDIATGGTFDITVNGETTTLDLTQADIDGSGAVSMSEFVDHFNANSENVSVSVLRTNGEMKLMFTSLETGADNSFQISASSGSGLESLAVAANANPIKQGQDAIIWLGSEGTGTKLVNSSNQFENVIQDITINLKKSQQSGDDSINAVVASDSDATLESLKELVSLFNDSLSTVSKYTGMGSENESRGILSSDYSMRSLGTQFKNILRGDFGGVRLFEIGIEFDRDGKLKIDEDKFEDNIEKVDLDKVFKAEGGVFERLTDTLDQYTDFSTGIIQTKRDSLNSNIDNYNNNLTKLDERYERLYNQYLAQFNVVNEMESKLNSLSSLFI